MWASGSGRGEVGGNHEKFSGEEEKRMRLLRTRGSVELGKVASSSATQGFGWETAK